MTSLMIVRTLKEKNLMNSEKVRVIEGVESGEFTLKIGKSEIFFVETSKNSESESIWGLDDWLFLGKKKSLRLGKTIFGKKESFVLEKFFDEIGKKEVLP